MSQTQTVQPTAKQPSCTRKTSGSMRRGFLLLLNRVGVTVDPCYCSSMNSVRPRIEKPQIKKTTDLTEIKWHILKSFSIYLSHNCCWVCMLLCCGIHSCRMLLLGNSVCLLKVNVPCYIWVTCYMPQLFSLKKKKLSCHFSTCLLHEVSWLDDTVTVN